MVSERFKYASLFLFTIALLLVKIAPATGQGFYRLYPRPAPQPWGLRLDTLGANGFVASYLDLLPSSPERIRRRFFTDANGVLTATDSFTMAPWTGYSLWVANDRLVSSGYFNGDTATLSVSLRTVPGATLWQNTLSFPGYSELLPVSQAQMSLTDSSVFVAGYALDGSNQAEYRHYFAKFSPSGQLIWKQIFDPALLQISTVGNGLITMATSDGGLLVGIYGDVVGDYTLQFVKIDAAGNVAWLHPVTWEAVHVVELSTGALVFEAFDYPQFGLGQTGIVQFSADGATVYEFVVGTALNLPSPPLDVRLVSKDRTGGILISVRQAGGLVHLARLDSAGDVSWQRAYPLFQANGFMPVQGLQLPDGNFVLAGPATWPDPALGLVKMDSLGQLFTNYVTGVASTDVDADCELTPAEKDAPPFFEGWPLEVVRNGLQIYTMTVDSGHYTVPDNLDTGAFSLRLIPPSYLWQPCPAVFDTFMPDTSYYTLQLDFPVQTLADCALMTVSAGVPFLRRCFPNTYTVRYCNAGTATADNVVVTVTLDPALLVNGASLPYTQSGQELQFAVGSVGALDCGTFTLSVTPDCDSTVLGQTLCLSVHITPDSFCLPPPGWSGATIVAGAQCLGDSVRLSLRNAGTAASTAGLDFIVVDDHVIMMQSQLPSLQPGEEYAKTLLADGASHRIIGEQEPNHPEPELPSAAVEGCGAASPGQGSLGFLLELPIQDGDAFSEHVCEPLVNSYDPNDKQAVPRGVGPAHLIEPGVPLTYKLRFQNTGTDTAFTVVIRDTLPAGLDATSVRPGAGSHAYTWALSGPGIVTFTFAGIALPDSNENEPASHGFVEFDVAQQPQLPPGTVLENRAGIFFDFNAPIVTNTVWHTIGVDFLEMTTHVPTPAPADAALQIYPNPAETAFFVTVSATGFQSGRCRVFDPLGRVAYETTVSGREFRIERRGLPAGVYAIVVEEQGCVVARGRVAWH